MKHSELKQLIKEELYKEINSRSKLKESLAFRLVEPGVSFDIKDQIQKAKEVFSTFLYKLKTEGTELEQRSFNRLIDDVDITGRSLTGTEKHQIGKNLYNLLKSSGWENIDQLDSDARIFLILKSILKTPKFRKKYQKPEKYASPLAEEFNTFKHNYISGINNLIKKHGDEVAKYVSEKIADLDKEKLEDLSVEELQNINIHIIQNLIPSKPNVDHTKMNREDDPRSIFPDMSLD